MANSSSDATTKATMGATRTVRLRSPMYSHTMSQKAPRKPAPVMSVKTERKNTYSGERSGPRERDT